MWSRKSVSKWGSTSRALTPDPLAAWRREVVCKAVAYARGDATTVDEVAAEFRAAVVPSSTTTASALTPTQIEQPTMADKLAADTAIFGYHNILRLQAWIGNISLVVERDLFGQTPLDEVHGRTVGERLAEELRRLEHRRFPLIDRADKMLMRSLHFLERRGLGQNAAAVTVGRADQVNVATLVANHPPVGT